MSKHISKYVHREMDHKAGFQHSRKRTKIVATVGPACDNYEAMLELVHAGVNVFRLNFSHGTQEDKARIIEIIRKINKTLPFNIAILADLQGPKLRVGEIENNALQINPGDILTFTNEKCIGTKEKIYVSYKDLHKDVKIGNLIMIDDGKLEVKVKNILPNNNVEVEVIMGGILSSKKGLNLPDTNVSLPALTEKDLDDLDFIITQNVDWIALSFVREVEDIKGLNKEVNQLFHAYNWPGNIRELKNVIKRACLLTPDCCFISKESLPLELTINIKENINEGTGLKEITLLAEREEILKVLREVNFNKSKAATILNIDRKTLYNKLKEFGEI